MSACLLQGMEKPSGGRGTPFFALALVSPSPWWCLLCIRYGQIKLNRELVRTCALRRKPNSTFLTEHLLVSSRLHEIVFGLFEINFLLCLTLNFRCRRLYDFFTQSANVLIILTACERISSSAEDDQMALPSVDFLNPLPCP